MCLSRSFVCLELSNRGLRLVVCNKNTILHNNESKGDTTRYQKPPLVGNVIYLFPSLLPATKCHPIEPIQSNELLFIWRMLKKHRRGYGKHQQ